MKKYIFALVLLLGLNSAVHAQDPKYANPKTLNMKCGLATIYGNTNDSWSVTIKGLDVAFWDNDQWSYGRYKGIAYDNTISESDESYENGRFFEYRGPKGDRWTLILGPTFLLEDNQVQKGVPHVYANLKVPGKMKMQTLECRAITLEDAKEIFSRGQDE